MLTLHHSKGFPHHFLLRSTTFRNSTEYLPLKALFKRNGGKYIQDGNYWMFSCSIWDYFIKELSFFFPVEPIQFQTPTTFQEIQTEAKAFGEMKKSPSRILFKKDFLKHSPLLGKAPNEYYQIQDTTKALNQNRYLLNQDPGLGKSFITTYLIKSLIERQEIQNALILTTKIGCLNLKDEILKFWDIDPEKILVLSSVEDTPFEDRGIFSDNKYTIIILTYNVLRYISHYYYDQNHATKSNPHPSRNKKYREMPIPFDKWIGDKKGCILLDESHWIGNPKANQTKLLLGHINNFYYRYLFTGTFAPKMEKMYSQLKILDPYLTHYLDYEQWLATYNDVGNYFSEWAINPLKWKHDRIEILNQKLVKDYAAKRKLTECLDLPPNIDIDPIVIDMHPIHRQLYESFVENYFELLSRDSEEENKSLSQKVYKHITLFQSCVDNPEILLKTNRFNDLNDGVKQLIQQFNYEQHNAKLKIIEDICEDRLDESGDTKGIIWYTHPATGLALNKYLKRKHLFVYRGMDQSINDVIKEFQRDDSQLLIMSLLMGNTSVTITESQFMIFLERDYSASINKQAKSRQARPGQTEITRNYSILFNKSLDMLQELILTRNSQMLENMISKGFVTQQEWSKIFNMDKKAII